MNYRLGVFGFFTHAELAAESEKKFSVKAQDRFP